MSKKTKRTTKARTTNRPPAKQPLAVPPLAVAIAKLADPDIDGISREFIQAYAAMPELVAALASPESEGWYYSLIEELSGLDAAEREAERSPRLERDGTADERRDDAMVVAVSRMNDPDLIADLMTPVMDSGFWVGAAYAAYMLTRGGAK